MARDQVSNKVWTILSKQVFIEYLFFFINKIYEYYERPIRKVFAKRINIYKTIKKLFAKGINIYMYYTILSKI